MWKVMRNVNAYQVWRQTRELLPGEPMHSGVREVKGWFETEQEAQKEADRLNDYEEYVKAQKEDRYYPDPRD